MPATLRERFEGKVGLRERCWLWTGCLTRTGYGAIGIGNRKTAQAHRVAYEIFVGPIPDGLWVLHSCDVRACVNPAHLFLGTHDDNMRDMKQKGRRFQFIGERNGRAKLERAQVDAIRVATGSQIDIGRNFGVSQTTVSRIKSGDSWKSCPPMPEECQLRQDAYRGAP